MKDIFAKCLSVWTYILTHRTHYIITLLLFIFCLQAITSAFVNSVTVDEFAHLPSGIYYWQTGNLKLYHHNPPLLKMWAALPVKSTKLQVPKTINNRWQLGLQFMFQNTRNYHLNFVLGRIMIIILSLLTGYILLLFVKKIMGIKAGLFALFLYTFSPNIIAHSYLVTTDLGVTFGIITTLYTFWLYLQRPSYKNIALCSFCFGVALLIKFSTLILLITLPFLAFLYYLFNREEMDCKKYLKGLLLIFLGAIFVVNCGYVFDGSFTLLKNYNFSSKLCLKLQTALPGNIPIPLPTEYIQGFDHQKYEAGNTPVLYYLCGQYSTKGWWYYFPMAMLLKTPIPLLLLITWGLFLIFRQKGRNAVFYYYILSFVAIFFFICCMFVMNIGLRYLLPIYPFLFIISARVSKERGKKARIGMSLLLIWLAITTISIYPHHLSYFNEIAKGADNGYKYLADSNLDWGQDLIFLRRYMKKNNIQTIYMSNFGLIDPGIYGIDYKPLTAVPAKGYIAISANHLLGISPWKNTQNSFNWLRNLKIHDKAGYSIFIYKNE